MSDKRKEKEHLFLVAGSNSSFIEERDESVKKDLSLKPKNESQSNYIKSILENKMVFGIRPAGTGKSYIAITLGLQALLDGKTNALILVKPVVETGPSVGSLPGDVMEKLSPFYESVMSILLEHITKKEALKLIDEGKICFRMLNFMRGVTLRNAWVILDEAQNSTPTKMKMFLTRFGENSKYIIDGDIDQIDIKGKSGLIDAESRLQGLSDIGFNYFNEGDCVREEIVKEILGRYRED